MQDTPLDVWVVDDDEAIRWVLERALKGAGMGFRGFADAASLRSALDDGPPQVVITDIRMPQEDGLSLLDHIQQTHPELPVIVVTAHSDLDSTVAAYRGGAFEYLPKPFDIDEAVALVQRAARHGVGGDRSEERPAYPRLIGQAAAMQEVFRAIGRLAHSSMTVLITGESGTGKELVARALHEHSPRARKPFIALNTSAIPSELLESELFGHERGAFTGADAARPGRFEQADGGTLFLDEIGDMSPALQSRLLRVLAEGEFYRVGGQIPKRVDVRVIAATHHDLPARVAAEQFREDLFHRLNVMHIETPPLRARREDVSILLDHYLQVAAAEMGVATKRISGEARDLLIAFDWPGNVRQLVNACRRLTVTAPGRQIETGDIPADLGGQAAEAGEIDWSLELRCWAAARLDDNDETPLLDEALPRFERALIEAAMERSQGHRQQAARMLGWGRNTLTRKIRELGIGD